MLKGYIEQGKKVHGYYVWQVKELVVKNYMKYIQIL